MNESLETLSRRAVGEWALKSQHAYRNPFADAALDATFEGPSGQLLTVPGFYGGEGTWRVRFSPNEVGAGPTPLRPAQRIRTWTPRGLSR